MKILIIEDEKALAKILKETFEQDKFEVQTASDGETGLSLAGDFRPDAIILDLILPRKHGFEVLAGLKKNPETENIPVIILSNLDSDESVKNAVALGAKEYCVKTDESIEQFAQKIKNLLLKLAK